MKRSLMSIVLTIFCLGVASNALADNDRRKHHDRGHHHSQRYEGRGDKHSHKHYRKHHDERRWHHRGPPPRAFHAPPPPRYSSHRPRWERGHRLPDRYRHHRYVVRDWDARHFHRPPRGYHWVNVGADYLLVGIATGVIMTTILGR